MLMQEWMPMEYGHSDSPQLIRQNAPTEPGELEGRNLSAVVTNERHGGQFLRELQCLGVVAPTNRSQLHFPIYFYRHSSEKVSRLSEGNLQWFFHLERCFWVELCRSQPGNVAAMICLGN
jgi:hypothetical protein